MTIKTEGKIVESWELKNKIVPESEAAKTSMKLNTKTSNKGKQDWGKEFDKSFGFINDFIPNNKPPRFKEDITDLIKDFIRQVLSNEKEKTKQISNPIYTCRSHPSEGWHEVGCSHQSWSKEQLQEALDLSKRFNKGGKFWDN